MEIVEFKKLFDDVNAIKLDERYIVFDDFELFDKEEDKSIKHNSFEELLEEKINGKTLKDFIEEQDGFDFNLNGGRGAKVGKGAKLFSGAGKKGKYKMTGIGKSGGNSFPAYLNAKTGQRYKSQDKTIKKFAQLMDKATTEHSASIDELGFATKYNKGGSGSTAFLPIERGMVVHNHPVYDKKGRRVAWNAFSGQDLLVIASDKKTKGIIATANGNKSIYKFSKKKSFDSKNFIKGINTARMSSTNYDKDVDSWLRKNAKKYGYSYSRTKYSVPKTRKKK